MRISHGHYAGLFAEINDALICRIKLVGPVISGRSNVGCIAGKSVNAKVILSKIEDGAIYSTEENTGGLVGMIIDKRRDLDDKKKVG